MEGCLQAIAAGFRPRTCHKPEGVYNLTEANDHNLRQRHDESRFAQLLGFEPVGGSGDRILLKMPFSDRLLQSLGRIHGGALFALADHASGWAAYSTLEPGERCATLEMKINYIAAVHDEDCLAEAVIVHRGRTSIVVESEIKTAAGRLVAKTLATFIVLKQ
jgi:acyl-CoA thioesterase